MNESCKKYLESDALELSTVVSAVGVEDGRTWIELTTTLFHPQGGGQPSDRGRIGGRAVLQVAHRDGQVRHFVAALDGLAVGDDVDVAVDGDARRLHARWHTAGHLLAAVLERAEPSMRAVAGHHWPGQGRVEFQGPAPLNLEIVKAAVESALAVAVGSGLEVAIKGDPYEDRLIEIAGFAPVPCGGTHVARTCDLGRVSVRKIKFKDNKLTVGYDLEAGVSA